MSAKCRNKVIIEISVEELMKFRVILGGLKSRESQFNDLMRALKKSNPSRKGLTADEMEALEYAINYPCNFADEFKDFFNNYEEIAALFSYSDND